MTTRREETLEKRWIKYLNNRMGHFDNSEIDTFIEENEMNEEEINFISALDVRVVLGDK